MLLRLLFTLMMCTSALVGYSQITAVGLIGPASPTAGWNVDSNLVQSTTDTAIWSATMALTVGECKLRANDAWTTSWGSTDFPSGVATTVSAPNFKIPYAGVYIITLNTVTGAYSFTVQSALGIIGTATAGGWDNDTDLYQDANTPSKFFTRLKLSAGEAKFRADNAWANAWGSSSFPSGIATKDGGNLKIPAGEYNIKIDTATGVFSFEQIVTFTTLTATGSAVLANGGLTRSADNADVWTGQVNLGAGSFKFSADTTKWGGSGFPAGTAHPDSAAITVVPAKAGTYLVVVNSKTGDYAFFKSVEIIGEGTPGGWATGTVLTQDAANPFVFRGRYDLKAGEAKFRADGDWAINWGGAIFPIGVAVGGGANIPISAGDYKIEFNAANGNYKFDLVVAYDTIGLIGEAGPNASWDADVLMTVDPANEFHFTLASAKLTEAAKDPVTMEITGGVKFRANRGWAVNWGDKAWPSGVGTPDGKNIQCLAGTYRVDFNTLTGAYSFGPTVGTVNLLDDSALAISPNPASSFMNIDVKDALLHGETLVTLIDVQGKTVMTQTINIVGMARIDVTSLVPGNYFVTLSNKNYMVGRQISIQR